MIERILQFLSYLEELYAEARLPKRPSNGGVTDMDCKAVTRVVWRFFLWPTSKWGDNPTEIKRRRGWQRVRQYLRYSTVGYPPKILGTYWDEEGIWAE